MKINEFIILLIGKSGTGKSTIGSLCEKKYGLKELKSYTTRSPRYDGEDTHIFVGEDDYEKMQNDICAFTVFDGHKYWATNGQVDDADIYIVDPAGVGYFKRAYKGGKKIVSIELQAKLLTRFKRMRKRGDSVVSALRRIIHDSKAFRNADVDIMIDTDIDSSEYIAERVYKTANLFAMLTTHIKEVRDEFKRE